MKHQLFSVYDSKAKAYMPPFVMHENAMAVRVFADCINDTSHAFGKNPQDYTLFNIGEFDDNKGQVTKGLNVSHGNGVELLRSEENSDQQQLFTDPPLGDLKEVN